MLACAVVVAGLAGMVLVLAGSSSPLRSPLIVLFLVTAPAMAVAGLLRGLDVTARVFLCCLAMIAINACVAETMLAAGDWSPRTGLVAVAVIAAVLRAVQLPAVRGLLRGRPGAGRAGAGPAGAGPAGAGPAGAGPAGAGPAGAGPAGAGPAGAGPAGAGPAGADRAERG